MSTGREASIVIPCYNDGEYLAEAVESALAQTRRAADVIVVDDGSTDDTAEIVRRFRDVRYIRQQNRGPGAARNAGAAVASADYLIFLDADDHLTPLAVEAGLECFAANPNCGFVYGRGLEFYDGGAFLPEVAQVLPERDSYAQLLGTCFVWMIHTVMYSKAAFVAAGRYDESLPPGVEDYSLNLAIARSFPIAAHSTLVAECRFRPTSISRNPGRMLRGMMTVMQNEEPHLGNNPALRRAHAIGTRKWKALYTPLLGKSVSARMIRGKWNRELARDAGTFARHGPEVALRRVVRKLRQSDRS